MTHTFIEREHVFRDTYPCVASCKHCAGMHSDNLQLISRDLVGNPLHEYCSCCFADKVWSDTCYGGIILTVDYGAGDIYKVLNTVSQKESSHSNS